VPSESRREQLSARISAAFKWPILIAALLVVPAVAIENSGLGSGWRDAARMLNWLIWSAFAMEFFALLAVTPNRLRWLRTHPLDVAIVILTPPFGPAALQSARALRLLRLIRLVRLGSLSREVFSLDGVKWCAVIALLLILGGGAGLVAIEGAKHHPHLTMVDGMWWAATTVTTVGYGDITPLTNGGRLIAMFIMLVGLGFVAILTGAVAQHFAVRNRQLAVATTDDILASVQEVLLQVRGISERLSLVEAHLALAPLDATASGEEPLPGAARRSTAWGESFTTRDPSRASPSADRPSPSPA